MEVITVNNLYNFSVSNYTTYDKRINKTITNIIIATHN